MLSGNMGFCGSSAIILTVALPQSILLHQIHETPYASHHLFHIYIEFNTQTKIIFISNILSMYHNPLRDEF